VKSLKKAVFYMAMFLMLSVFLSSCTLFIGSIDKKNGFSEHLDAMENHIRDNNWEKALVEREEAFKVWQRIKPLLQLDVDHDYVNDIEDYFVMLGAYLETQNKSQSLAMVYLIRETWDNLSVM